MNKRFTDMMDRQVELDFPPKRIISVVPSQTELLYDLGLDDEVVGITKFCVHPKHWHEKKTRIGGTKNLQIEKIIALQPDLIIANKEENTQAEIEALSKHCPVWISDIKTFEEAIAMIKSIGELADKETKANELVAKIEESFATISKPTKPIKIAYFIWRNPWMSVGNDNFIHDIITKLGWTNVFADETRYPETSLEKLAQLAPDVILLSSEPYPFSEKHIAEVEQQLPNATILLVDGELFSWYGSRMQLAIPYFTKITQSLW